MILDNPWSNQATDIYTAPHVLLGRVLIRNWRAGVNINIYYETPCKHKHSSVRELIRASSVKIESKKWHQILSMVGQLSVECWSVVTNSSWSDYKSKHGLIKSK